ncbi:MAG: hypothetical protein BWY78_00045 [Alphaproteobacteria bacterium ADurb.Bin438]|nr:MAG: hypothetical protein BWY78_00045 [Alphaproteobacteria bacterium ADurb.Bin438]
MIIEIIIGVIAVVIALFMYFIGKDVKEKDIQDKVIDDLTKAKEIENEVNGFDSDRIINELSKYKK